MYDQQSVMYAQALSPVQSVAYGGAVPLTLPALDLESVLFPHLIQYLGHWRHGYRTTALLFALGYLDGDLLHRFYQYCLYYWPMLDEQERDLVRRIELKLGGIVSPSVWRAEASEAIGTLAGVGAAIENGARMAAGVEPVPVGLEVSHDSILLRMGEHKSLLSGGGGGCGCASCQGGVGACPCKGAPPPRNGYRATVGSPSHNLRSLGDFDGYSLQNSSPFRQGTVGFVFDEQWSKEMAEAHDQYLKQGLSKKDPQHPDYCKAGGDGYGTAFCAPANQFDWNKFTADLLKAGVDVGKAIMTSQGVISPAECMQNPNDPRCATLKLPDNPTWRSFCNTPTGRVFRPCIFSGYAGAIPPANPANINNIPPWLQNQGMNQNTMMLMMFGFAALALMFMRGGI